jgi:hypothetical protein
LANGLERGGKHFNKSIIIWVIAYFLGSAKFGAEIIVEKSKNYFFWEIKFVPETYLQAASWLSSNSFEASNTLSKKSITVTFPVSLGIHFDWFKPSNWLTIRAMAAVSEILTWFKNVGFVWAVFILFI